MRLILIHNWTSDCLSGTDIFPIIHESPEVAFVDFCESYSNYDPRSNYIFRWRGLEFCDNINPDLDIDFKTVDEFFSKVEKSPNSAA